MKLLYKFEILLVISLFVITCSDNNINDVILTVTTDDGTRLILQDSDLEAGTHHTRHIEIFGNFTYGYNLKILEAIDIVQSTAAVGGGSIGNCEIASAADARGSVRRSSPVSEASAAIHPAGVLQTV